MLSSHITHLDTHLIHKLFDTLNMIRSIRYSPLNSNHDFDVRIQLEHFGRERLASPSSCQRLRLWSVGQVEVAELLGPHPGFLRTKIDKGCCDLWKPTVATISAESLGSAKATCRSYLRGTPGWPRINSSIPEIRLLRRTSPNHQF